MFRPSNLTSDSKDILYKTLHMAVEQSPISVVITDAQACIVYANPKFESLTGYRLDEVLGKNPRIFKSGAHDASFYEALWAAISSGKSWTGEFRNMRKDGSLYWESATISPVADDDGEILFYFALKTDITVVKAMEQELQEQRKELSEFAHMMAHDIRNPLQVIRGYAELIDCDPVASEKIVNKVQDIQSFVERSLDLADSGRIVGSIQDVNMNAVASAVCCDVVPESISYHIAKLPTLSADLQKTSQILQNVVSNAVMHGDPAVISIAARIEGGYHVIDVADDGRGMSQSVAEHAFDKGFTTSPKGTGFGLAMVSKIMRAMGGFATLSSEEGTGTTVSLFFRQ